MDSLRFYQIILVLFVSVFLTLSVLMALPPPSWKPLPSYSTFYFIIYYLYLAILLPRIPHLWFLYTFLNSVITPYCILIPENLQLGTTDEKEHRIFIYPSLSFITQYNIFYVHPFIWNFYNFIFISSRIVFHCVYVHFLYQFIS